MYLHYVRSSNGHMHKLSSRCVLTPCQIVSWLHSKTYFQLCSYTMSVHLMATCTNLFPGMCLHHVSSSNGHMHKLISRYVLTPCQIVSWLHSKTQFQLCSYIMSVHLIAICTNLVLGKCLHHVSSSHSHMHKLSSRYVLTPCQFISWPHVQTQFQVSAYTMSVHLMAICTNLVPGMCLHHVSSSNDLMHKLISRYVLTPCQLI